jgi:uncharacterized protein YqgV (UPF0045/DUF77 family)
VKVSVQFSVYPLGQDNLDRPILAACEQLAQHDVRCKMGDMSTTAEGEARSVFTALAAAFEAAAGFGGTVMVCTVSNACPAKRSE